MNRHSHSAAEPRTRALDGSAVAGFALLLTVILAATPAVGAAQAAPHPEPRRALLHRSVDGLLPDSLRTEVLVLGSTHLRGYDDNFRPELLDGLISALESWEPDAVGVERLPPGYYRTIGADDEPEVGRTMQEALEVDLERAVLVSDSLLEARGADGDPSPRIRLDLVTHLVAAHRLPTATLHWMRLDRSTRSAADLPDRVREALERRAEGLANETYSVGMRLARTRGLPQVHPIDDRTADRVYDLEEAVADGLRDHLVEHPGYSRVQEYVREDRRRVQEAIEAGDLLSYYRWKNAPETVERDVRLQWGIFLELAEETPMARKRLAHWEIRNLKMVRRIREMALHHPGGRVVVVVGAGHKAFFDDYLDRMLDVEVVQLAEVLEAAGTLRPPAAGWQSAPAAASTATPPDSQPARSHYRIDARIEPSSGRVDVELVMRWVPETATDTLSFFLHRDLGRPVVDSDAERVAGITVEPVRRFAEAFDSDSSYTNRVTVALEETATPKQPVELVWSYGGTLRTDRIRLGGSAVTPHWVELQIGSLWVPTGTSLRQKFSFEADVELPEGFEVVSSGPVERDGTSHHIRSPVSNPDVPLIASDQFRTVHRGDDGPPVTVYHAGAPDSLVSFIAGHAEHLLARYDERFRSGRELQSLRITIPPVRRARPELYARPGLIAMSAGTDADAGRFRLLAHEAAHLWWTDAADTQSMHNFMNESFAEYAAYRSVREVYGREAFEEQIERARKAAAEAPGLDEWSPQLNDSLTRRKGPWLLHLLHQRIGEDAYLRFVRALQRDDTGTLEEMIRVLAETTDAETARWFREKLFSRAGGGAEPTRYLTRQLSSGKLSSP